MRLTRSSIPSAAEESPVSFEEIFQLPETVLQFGTGVLLRALPDYFIDKANKQGFFNGRIVVVKTTDSDSSAFDKQDGLYTVCVRGVEDGVLVRENIINASISRVLSAKTEWSAILKCASNPALKLIISNTTEVGIQLVEDSVHAAPPVSFPGKLLCFLYQRFNALGGTPESGMIIVPTELITNNGALLKHVVLELARQNKLDFQFIEWLENHNHFCNSLVDRIVPGKPAGKELHSLQEELGYEDDLLTMSEAFRLWAIEGDEKVKEVLSFSKADQGVVVVPDITLFKELKLRLLNGTHTFNCATAFLCGFNITREAVMHPVFGSFTRQLMNQEIAPAIPFTIEPEVKTNFANKVFERFCNPFIDHQWQSITVQITSKMKMRNVPLLLCHYERCSQVPLHMATGFAAFLLYMKVTRRENGRFFGIRNGEEYEIKDEQAPIFQHWWATYDPAGVAEKACAHIDWWGTDLSVLPGFLDKVKEQLTKFMSEGILATIKQLESNHIGIT